VEGAEVKKFFVYLCLEAGMVQAIGFEVVVGLEVAVIVLGRVIGVDRDT
jgi:hypothetical protein